MPNYLSGESSPYLLQHADNPVDWYPWGEKALERARREDKPIFLSIGYSACHWCHVMERESFTDRRTADYLNRHFINIKVDREERPDLDALYMQAVTSMTGRGGWPLSVWLTPEGAPFYGGTYYPPSPRFGMPSFLQVLEAITSAWSGRRGDIVQTAARLLEHLGRENEGPDPKAPQPQLLDEVTDRLRDSFDPLYGGWGEAPKFPQPMVLDFLLAQQTVSPRPDLASHIGLTLDAMAAGGMYDHLGGGFHRYSTDDRWLVPHFEKMLYDNAQLARCYLHAWLLLGNPHYRRVVEQTLDYLIRDMRHPQGGFFSAEDADSEGKEGAFYVWTLEQIQEVLGPEEAEFMVSSYGVTADGNFEGANILHEILRQGQATDNRIAPTGGVLEQSHALLEQARIKLLSAREKRPRPARDEKVLAGWNGLTLAALAEAASTSMSTSDHYREMAIANARFIAEELVDTDHRLIHVWKDGHAHGNGFLEDYACVVDGLLALYQCTFSEKWFALAQGLTDTMIEHFRRPSGGFHDTSDDHEALVVRPRSLHDSPTPCGNSLTATVLLKMAAYTGEVRYSALAHETLATVTAFVTRAPAMFGQWLSAFHLAANGTSGLAVVGDLSTAAALELLSVARSSFRPALIVAARPPGAETIVPLLERREPASDTVATAWLCRGSTCLPPTSDAEELSASLDA